MGSFSENDKAQMRKAQLNKCARCLKELEENEGEAHSIFRSHSYPFNGILLCNTCHQKNYSYGIPPLRIGDQHHQLID